ncbi:MAG: CotH kinase family protein [Crocinitomicaceae bacterium]|nr:CotH kinase family protein [Crocinitomicaceae bacterium]
MLKGILPFCFFAILFDLHSQAVLHINLFSGIYNDTIVLTISGKYDAIYYTTDGTSPNKSSNKWKDSLIVNENLNLRFKPVIDGHEKDTVFNYFYLFNFNKKLPIVHVSIDPEDLWSGQKGIYVSGDNAYKDSLGNLHNRNYYKNWEKNIHFMYFDDNSFIEQDCGIKLFGESTRKYPDKSFKIIARSKYGSKSFRYNFFPLKNINKHKQLVIRTSGNDFKGTRFKDVLSAYLARNIGVDYMAYQPVHFFINAEYWGVYNLREKVNEHYLKNNKGIDKDSLSIIKGKWVLQHGKKDDYMKMYKWFLHLNKMDSLSYIEANKFLDIRNYINFRIFQLYINNPDSRGNIRYWNSNQTDGKFRMILYDTDHGYGSPKRNFLKHSLNKAGKLWSNPPWSTRYLVKLMENKEFKNEFLVQYAHLLNTSLHKDTVIAAINHFEDLYINELPRPRDKIASHLKRVVQSEEKWLKKVEKLRLFAVLRNKHVKSNLASLLGKDGWFNLEVSGNSGKISVNDNYPICLPFKGEYLIGFDFNLTACDDGLYHFVRWSDGDTNRTKKVFADSNQFLSPIFIQKIPEFTVKHHKSDVKNKSKKTGLPYFYWFLYSGGFLLLIGLVHLTYLFLKKKKKRNNGR